MIKEMVLWLWTNFKSHIANSSAHHTKYTDAEAVSAADASDKFIERNVINTITGETELKRTSSGPFMKFTTELAADNFALSMMRARIQSTNNVLLDMSCSIRFPHVVAEGTDLENEIGIIYFRKACGSYATWMDFRVSKSNGFPAVPLILRHDKLELDNIPIIDVKDPTNAQDADTKNARDAAIAIHTAITNAHHTPGASFTVAETQVFSGSSPTSWTNLDLSGTISSNKALVLLRFESASDMNALAVRKDGDTTEYYNASVEANAYGCALGHHNNGTALVLWVAASDAGKIEWKTETSQTATVTIMAYIK